MFTLGLGELKLSPPFGLEGGVEDPNVDIVAVPVVVFTLGLGELRLSPPLGLEKNVEDPNPGIVAVPAVVFTLDSGGLKLSPPLGLEGDEPVGVTVVGVTLGSGGPKLNPPLGLKGDVEDPNPGIVVVPVTLLLIFSCLSSITYLISTDDTHAFFSNVYVSTTRVDIKD